MLTAHLNQKLSALIPKDASFAIAFSGGGDSTALVHALKDHPQARHVYIVDHDLREGSAAEAQAANDFALACGYDSRVLKWLHDKPNSALQEKARKARYGLIGDQCRKDRIKFLLTAHSEDDQAETLLMRYERKTDWRGAAGMAERTYGAVWPELVSINLVRPLLDVRRETLRDYIGAHDLKWAEDPSNDNRDYARIRARDYLKTRPDLGKLLLDTAAEMRAALDKEKSMLRLQFSHLGQVDEYGIITLADVTLSELMFHCLRCAGGQGGIIDRAKIKSLLSRMHEATFKSATLGGAMVAKRKTGFIICRDPVAVKGRQDSHHERVKLRRRLNLRLSDIPQLWDGRFLVSGSRQRSYMGSVFHNRALMTDAQKKMLKGIPAPARVTLPVSKMKDSIRILGADSEGSHITKCIVKTRLEAALGGQIS